MSLDPRRPFDPDDPATGPLPVYTDPGDEG